MPNADPEAYGLPDAALSAVFKLEAEIKQRAARRLIHRLRRVSASGIYGEDYKHHSLWDELCHEQQKGPHFDEDVWDDALEGLLQAEVERLTPGEFEVVWVASLPDVDDLRIAPRIQVEVQQEFLTALNQLASKRNLDRFEVWDD